MPPPSAASTSPRHWRRVHLGETLLGRVLGRRMFAVAWLTLKAAFRYRLMQILTGLLIVVVLGLPAVIKHDGTAQGFTQILLTYTLGSVTLILGFATLWLACGTLARDIEECQMQIVVVKPIARWEIWLGKWLGLLALNASLLALSGVAIYGVMQWRASLLPARTQEELRTRVLVARGSIKEQIDAREIDAEVERQLAARLEEANVAAMDREFVRKQLREQIKAQFQIVRPGMARRWTLDFGALANTVRDRPLTVRTRFAAAQRSASGTYYGVWEIGPPEGRRYRPDPMSLAPETFHEFLIPPGSVDLQGRLVIDFQNYNDTAVLFPLEDGLEVLYAEGSFGLNFVRALGIVLFWLALLSSIGLAAASFLSFPVAAFLALAILLVGFSSGTLKQVIAEGGVSGVNQNTGRIEAPSLLNRAAVKVFSGLLAVINLAQDFSPVDSLSTGRSVSWREVARAALQVVGLLGGLFAVAGILLFQRRELATAQGG